MVAAASLSVGLIPRARAANFFWDTNGATAGLGGATGNWDTTTANWFNAGAATTADGAGGTSAVTFTSADVAYFTGTSGDVGLGSPVTVGGLNFGSAGYRITGDATSTLMLAGASPSIRVGFGLTADIGAKVSGSDGFTLSGGGALRLSNAGNDYSGITRVANGVLIVSSASALGADSSTISVTTANNVPGSTALLGIGGGSLVLDGSVAGFSLARNLNIEGRGTVGDRGAALISYGMNGISGAVVSSSSDHVPATFRNTRVLSVYGDLSLTGSLSVPGTAGTTFTTFGGVNQSGASGYALSGVLAGSGTLQKTGGGMLLLNPSDATGFTGRVRVSTSVASGQSSVRVVAAGAFGVGNSGTTNASVDMDGGVLEIRSDASLDFARNVYVRANSTVFYAGESVGGSGINGTVAFQNLSYEDNITLTFNGRNGYGFSFTTAPVNGGDNFTTFTNNLPGQLRFDGNIWSNSDTGAARTLTFNGNGRTFVNGSVIAAGGANFDHVFTKQGTGLLTITGIASTLDGAVNSHGGAIAITDFRSLNNASTSAINIGTGGTASGLIIVGGASATSAGLTTSRPVNLSGSTGTPSIYADQPGPNPVVFNGEFSTTAGAATESKTLILGGANAADNTINAGLENQASATTGSLALRKQGAGTWVLAGANTYTGLTTIVNGTLKIRANAATSTVLPSANDITFGNDNVYAGGSLEFVGQNDVNNLQTLDVLSTSSGAATIRLTPGAGGTASLTFASQSTSAGGTVNFVGGDFVSNRITITGANGLVSRTNYWNGTDFAYRESNVLRAPVYGTDSGFSTSSTSLTSAANMQVTGSFSTNSVTISTLKIAGSHTLSLNSAQTLTLSNGGVLVTGGNAVITGGTALALSSQALVVRANLAADSLEIQSPVTGSGGLTKAGAGTLILSAANSQTGTISINEGTVRLSGSGRLGAAADLTMRQLTTLDLNGVTPATATNSFNNNGSVTSATPATFTVGGNNGTGTSFGTVDGALSLTKIGTGAQSWLGASTYTGVSTIGSTGLVTVDLLADIGQPSGIGRGDATSDATNAASLVFNGSTGGIAYRGDFMVGTLSLGSLSASTNRLFTLSGTGATIASSPTANLNNAIIWSNVGALVHGVTGPQTLTFNGTSQGDNRFNPRITDSGTAANVTSVTKTGTGIWHLGAAANTYGGPTLITQGVLGATDGQGLSPNSNLRFDGGTLYSQGVLARDIGTGAGQMSFVAPAANTAQFSGGFQGGATKLTVNWSGTPVWGSTAGFISARDGLILNGSQARAQGSTGSIAISEVELAGNFSLGSALAAGGSGLSFTLAQNSSTVSNLASTAGLSVGQSFVGTNVPSGAYIVSINSASQITLSANTANTGGIAGNYADGAFPSFTLRTIRVDDNGNTGADFATLSGSLSAGDSVTGIRKLGGGILWLTGANTYLGETSINQGTLVIRSLGSSTAQAGTATSVGLSGSGVIFDNSNAVTVGNGGTGAGILQYAGPGETSDRKIRLNTTTGSVQIHADGSGPLVLQSVVNDMVVGAKTLFLRGNSPFVNVLSSQLTDNGGVLSLTIDGGTSWVLAHAQNSYTGITTVSAGALGIGHDSAVPGVLTLSNGSVFAHGGARTFSGELNLNNNTTNGFQGDRSLTFSGNNKLNLTSTNSVTLNNGMAAGAAVVFNGLKADSLTSSRQLTLDGPGETVINGAFTTTTTFGVNIVKTGDGTLTLGTNGAASNWNQAGTGIDLDRGLLKFTASEAIRSANVTDAGLTISPEVATVDVATVDLNGTTQTVNGLTATSNGVIRIDNTSSGAASFRFGANNATVNFGSGVGDYAVQNTGSGPLDLVKLGNTSATFNSGVTVGNKGTLASEGGGSFIIAGPVTAATGLRAIEGSTLALTGGIADAGLLTSIEVGGGSTLSLLDGAGSQMSNLSTLKLGNTGTGTVTLNLNVGEGATDTISLGAGKTPLLGNTVTFNLTDAGLNEQTTYTLLEIADGGITTFGVGNMIRGATPGGFTSMTWVVTDNLVQLSTGALIVGDVYWRGSTDTKWNANANNWSKDKSGVTPADSIPGAGNKVIFAYDGVGATALATTLEQNIKINSLLFESGSTTPSSVTIDPGASPTSRLEIAPSSGADGIAVTSGGPSSITISGPVRLGGAATFQTWNVVDAGATLSLGALLGERDVVKSGAGKVILTAASDPTFNAGQTADFTINAGNLELTNAGALGNSANNNLVNLFVNGGGFYYKNAAAGTVPNPVTLAGGTLSGGGANHTYSGLITVSGASTVNLADSNGPVTAANARDITLSGALKGAGTLTIDSHNVASGGNQLAGTLSVSGAAGDWSGNLVFNRGTVSVEAAASASVLPADITFSSFGRYIVKGVDGRTIDRGGALTLAASAVGEFQVDNTTTTQLVDFVVNQNGAVSFGSGSALRVALPDQLARFNLAGSVTLAGPASLSVSNNATRILTVSGVIGESVVGSALAVNDDQGSWGATNGIVRLTGANTFTGGVTVADGVLEFSTVTAASGGASNLGQGTAITLNGGTLRFAGSSDQTTNRSISLGGGASLATFGASGARITYSGAISAAGNTLTLAGAEAASVGSLTGGVTQTGTTADLNVNSGSWTLSGSASVLADDIVVTGSSAVLNLNGGSLISFTAGTSNGLYARTGATINLLANDVFGPLNSGSLDFILLGDNSLGVGTLNVGTFSVETPRLDLGQRVTGYEGQIDGTGTVLVRGGFIDLFRGTVNANLASDGSSALEKYSLGTVTLKGDNSGLTSSGSTVIFEGTLVLDYSANNATKVRSASALEMRGGNLTLSGNSAAATVQSVASYTLGNGGANVITINAAGGQGLVLNLGAITRAVNAQDGTLRVVLPAGAQGASNGVTTTTALSGGVVGGAGFMTVDDGTGVWFASKSGDNIVALASVAKNDVTSWNAGDHVTDAGAGYAGSVALAYPGSIRFNAAAGSDVILSATGALGVATGGILVTANAGGTPSLMNGTLFSGAQASNVAELIITQDSSSVFEIGADLRVSLSVTKSGAGTLRLSGVNNYTGSTEVQNGVLQLSGGAAVGDSSIVTLSASRNSTLQLLSNETIGRLQGGARQNDQDLGIVDVGVCALTINQSANTTYSGRFTGSGSIVLNAGSTGNLNYNGQSSTGLFTGSFVVNGGLLQVSGDTARLGSAVSFTINGAASLLLDNDADSNVTDRIADTADLILNSASGAWSGQTVVRGLSIRNNDNDDSNETVGTTTFNGGVNYLSLEASGGASAQARIISTVWARNNSATLNVRGRNLGASSDSTGRSQFKVQDANDASMLAANVGGGGAVGGSAKNVSVLPWAVGEAVTAGMADTNMGNTFLSYVDNRGLVPLHLTNEYAAFSAAGSSDNVRQSLTAHLGSLAGKTVNSIVLHYAGTAAGTYAVSGTGAGQALTVTSGGFLFTRETATASTAYVIQLSGFDDGIAVGSSNEYVFHVINPDSASVNKTLTASVVSKLTSSADITKSGRGTLVLGGLNTAGGGTRKTTINEGLLEISDLDNIGGTTGSLVFAGGGLRLGAGHTDDLSQRTITFLAGGGTIDTNGIDLTLSNGVGSGVGGLTKAGTGNLTLNGSATYTGPTLVSGGTLTVGATNATGNGGNLTVGAGATLALGTASITSGVVTVTGASPVISGTGTITASGGFFINPASSMTIGAVLAGPGGLFKNTNQEIILTGLSTYAGTTEVQDGILTFNSIANVGGGASALGAPATASEGIIRVGRGNASVSDLRYTGTGHSSDRLVGIQGTSGTGVGVEIYADGTGALGLGGVRMENAGDKLLVLRGTSDPVLVNTIGGIQQRGGVLTLNKTDANTWRLSQASNHTGATQVDYGTLQIGLNDALPVATALRIGTGGTAGTLDLIGFNQTIGSLTVQTNSNSVTNGIVIGAGRTFTVNGAVTIGSDAAASTTLFAATGGGAFVNNNSGGTFAIGGATGATNVNAAQADFSGLGTFTVNLGPTGTFRIGDANSNTGNPAAASVLTLAANSSTITAGTLNIGQGTAQGNSVQALKLGAGVNTLNVNTVNIGANTTRSGGEISFAGASGSLVMRGADGTGAVTALNMVNNTLNTAFNLTSNFLLAGRDADVLATTFTMASRTAGNGSVTSTLTFDQGTLDVTTLNMASRTGAGTGAASATVNIGGGAVLIDSLGMSVNTSAGGAVTSNLNITGGTVSIGTGSGTALNMANAGTGRSVSADISLTGGTLNFSGDVIRTGGAGTENANLTLNGGTLDLNGFAFGSASANLSLTAESGTLRDVGTINGTGGLNKSGGGMLTLEGSSAYVGSTTVSAGTLTAAAGALAATSGIAVNGATLTAVNYNAAATLTLDATGSATVSGTGLTFSGAVTNANTTASSLNFSGTSGKIILASLAGAGSTRFGSDADITGGVGAGTVTVVGALGANVTGGTVSAATMVGDVSGGDVSVTGLLTGNVSAGAGTVSAGSMTGDAGSSVTVTGLLTGAITAGTNSLGSLSSSSVTGGTSTITGAATVTTLNGGTLTVGGVAAVTTLTTGTLNANGATASVTTLNGGDIALATTALTVQSGTHGGVISGVDGSLTKSGVGTLTVSGANTFGGATTVSAGVLAVAHADALGTSAAGTSVTSGAELRLQGGITVAAETLTLNGMGVSSAGALRNFSGDNAFAGAVTVASAARINSDAGTLTLSGGVTAADFGLTFGGAGNVTIDTTGLSLGTGSLTKDGAGLLLLSLANTFSGGTTVSAGTLKIGATGSLGSGAVSVASGATLDLNNLTIGNAITLADGATLTGGSLPTTSVPTSGVIDVVLTGTAPLEKTDTGRLELTGENTFTGATSVSAGTIAVADFGNGSTASPLGVTDLADPSKLILAGASGVIPVLEFTGSTGATTARSFTVGGDGAGIAAGSGAGALVFTSDAKINLTSADAEFRLVANNTAVNRFEATLATGSPGLKDVVIDGTGQWVIAGPANRFAGDFRLDVAGGTLKFESGALGDSSYVGSQIEVSDGAKLVWSGTNTDDISARLAIPVGATAQLDLGSNNVTFAGSPSVGGGATIQKQGAGTLTFSSAVNAPNLDVSLSSGTLVVNGSLGDVTVGSGAVLGGAGTVGNVTAGSGAIIAPGNSPDTLFGISMNLSGGSIFQWEVYKPSLGAGVGYDNIELTGALYLTGSAANNKIILKVISLNASNVQGGVPDGFSKDNIYSFNFATVGSVVYPSGVTSANINDIFSIDVSQFQYSDGSASNSGLWSLSYDDNGMMTLTAVPEPSTYGFAMGALALAAAAVRRRRRAKV